MECVCSNLYDNLKFPVLFRYKRSSSLSFGLFMVVRLSQILRKYVISQLEMYLLCLHRFLLDLSLRGMISYSRDTLSMYLCYVVKCKLNANHASLQ
uniref:Uncharacterized protein n=1 Tax=Picea sitchensis TaxID=3332 RepID=A9NK36_PICSI|nr:unknown [Picea sitchensis]